MGYALNFIGIDLAKAKEAMQARYVPEEANANDVLIDIANDEGSYLDEIRHASGFGGVFEEYVRTIAGDYFSEPHLFELMMSRTDLFPFTKDRQWGYLKKEEIQRFLLACAGKDAAVYFEDNDDFEEDLDVMKDVFEAAISNDLDILCIYE